MSNSDLQDLNALEELSAQISKHVANIKSQLNSRISTHEAQSNNPSPPPSIQQSRHDIVQICEDFRYLILGPVDCLVNDIVSTKVDIAVLRTLSGFNVPEAVPKTSDTNYASLSEQTGLSEDILKRLIRYAATQRMFKIVKGDSGDERIAHTPMSRALVENERLRGILRHNFDDCFLGFYKLAEWLKESESLDEPSQSPFSFALNIDKSWFDWMNESAPGRDLVRKSYHQTLGFLQEGVFSPDHAASTPLFQGLGENSTIVDIGGSTGHVSIALAKKLPHPKFIVQDLPSTIAKVDPNAIIPEILRPRISFTAHNFFDPQPTQADVYLLRYVLHDWPDAYCIRVIRGILPQLKRNPSASLALLETVLPEPGVLPPALERQSRSADLQMLCYASARERDARMWEELVGEASGELVVKRIHVLHGCAYSVIEVGVRERLE